MIETRAMPMLVVVTPHPDDEAYPFGGVMALAARARWRVVLHCATSGEAGERYDGGEATPRVLGPRREQELAASCQVLGAEPPVLWHLPDGGVRPTADAVARLATALTDAAPDLVLTLGADGAYGHPDHLAVHRWVTGAWTALAQRPPLLFAAFPAGLFAPHWDACRAMFGDPPNPPRAALGRAPLHYTVPIRSAAETKLAALGAHRSQLPEGDPRRLFPPGIIDALLEEEWFTDARGGRDHRTALLLASLTG
jgi:LmbE family N-acetylglucosaminyl deacetylase